MVPVPGRSRTRAIACLRRPVDWTSGFSANVVLLGPGAAARRRDVVRNRGLGGMRMGRAGVDLELAEHRAAEAVLRNHALDRLAHDFLRPLGHEICVLGGAQPARVARVPVRDLLVELVGREDDLVGVHDDDEVAGVDVRRVDRLVLAPEQVGDLGGEATEDQAVGIDDVPRALDVGWGGAERAHRDSFEARVGGRPASGPTDECRGHPRFVAIARRSRHADVRMPDTNVTRSMIEDAATRVAGVLRPTPVYRSEALSKVAGRPVLLKPEQRQRTGSFKIRGAYNKISRLDPSTTPAVVAASAGNHAQGVALAAKLSGIPATIFMPANVSLPKLQATQGYGADVVLVNGTIAEAIKVALDHVAGTGGVWVHPFDDPLIIAGQGTIGLEIVAEAPDVDTVVVPVGGGGLVTGIAEALDGVHVVGVRPADPENTIADGIAVSSPMPLLVGTAAGAEGGRSRAVVLLLERSKSVVEPAGAAGLAAVLSGAVPGDGPVVVVLSGGNVDPMLLTSIVDHGLTSVGRYLVIQVVLGDRPGQLAALTAAVAEQRANVVSIEHHREGVGLPVGDTQVRLTLETRDRQHGDGVIAALEHHGFAVRRD